MTEHDAVPDDEDRAVFDFAARFALASNQPDSVMQLSRQERRLLLSALPQILLDDRRKASLATAVLTGRNDREERPLNDALLHCMVLRGLSRADNRELVELLLHPEQWGQLLERIHVASTPVHTSWRSPS